MCSSLVVLCLLFVLPVVKYVCKYICVVCSCRLFVSVLCFIVVVFMLRVVISFFLFVKFRCMYIA